MPKWLTPEEVSDILQVSPKTIREWCRCGKLPARKFGKLWRIKEGAWDVPK